VPVYGINGAAFSTMVSYIVWSLLSLFTAKYQTNIFPIGKKMLRIILVSIIPALLLFFIRNLVTITLLALFILVVFFLLLYFLLIFLTHSLDKNDLIILKAIKSKITRT
jgi:O-antigen/teichoic acid export membrane protein